MNILVTGAAGFIGSHVCEQLLALGHTVVGIDNFNEYYNPQYKEENSASFVSHHSFTLVRADITDMDAMTTIFNEHTFDTIIHLAAQAGVRASIERPLMYQKNNVGGTYLLFELARGAGVQNIIFASSSSVYGNAKKIPFSETDSVDHPISPYAATKKACELIAYTYHHLYNINCIGLRFFTVYGERGRLDMSPYLFTDLLLHDQPITRYGDGSTQRDFTYIKDIVNGIVACLDKQLGYEIINLGNSKPVSLQEYIETLERVTGKKAVIEEKPIPAGDVLKTYVDVSKAKQLLGWEPTTSLEDGLTQFVKWFKEHRA